ncbi:Lnb N-terminal periplasmic domain-containing protein [Desulfogranum mediterraneum]|uniref:Lnb N-terminal periplasmic domain-containing protein n=1 Tax=Desulfogranum mediterraneum TaxID=160661 RepID=UPI000688EEDB|nr:DUF4105 domain-containing protein [Desulfogranum mediterraneum]
MTTILACCPDRAVRSLDPASLRSMMIQRIQGWMLALAAVLCFCQLFLITLPREAVAAASAGRLAELKRRAGESGLWQSPGWLGLLHYPRSRGGAPGQSRIDGGTFFLAPRGKQDPGAEGEATLEALFAGPKGGEEDLRCRYPARYDLLLRALAPEQPPVGGAGAGPGFLPELSCPRLGPWLKGINGVGVTLAFPVSYLNNPASMFGHTLLRIDSADFSPHHPLLAAAIGFAAVTQEEHGLGYALKGIFGGYSGRFSAEPYYLQAQRYGELENRDIWEYPLDLSPAETRYLLYHLWELQQAEFAYFFFSENCSYQLLALLEAVRPSLDLSSGFRFWTMPVETVGLLVETMGRDGKVSYRPSLRRQLQARAAGLGPELVKLAKTMARADGGLNRAGYLALAFERQAQVLEFAQLYLRYLDSSYLDLGEGRNGAAGEGAEATEQGRRGHELNLARSRLGLPAAGGESYQVSQPARRPDQGHPPARLELGFGREGGRSFLELGLRPALHDLSDPLPGYDPGAEIELFSSRFRYSPEQEQLSLEGLELVHILAAAPGDGVSQPLAWKGRLAMERYRFEDDRRSLAARGEFGFGRSVALSPKSMAYALLGGSVLASDQLVDRFNLGPSCFFGLWTGVSQGWQSGIRAELTPLLLKPTGLLYRLEWLNTFQLSTNSSLVAEAAIRRDVDQPTLQLGLRWRCYFAL